MAVIIDIGDADDIHPKNKQDVGKRLALWALAKDYGKNVVYSGPLYKSMKKDGGKIVLSFDHVGGGLVAKGDELDRLRHRRGGQEVRLGRCQDRRRHGRRLQPEGRRPRGRPLRLGRQPGVQPVQRQRAAGLAVPHGRLAGRDGRQRSLALLQGPPSVAARDATSLPICYPRGPPRRAARTGLRLHFYARKELIENLASSRGGFLTCAIA